MNFDDLEPPWIATAAAATGYLIIALLGFLLLFLLPYLVVF